MTHRMLVTTVYGLSLAVLSGGQAGCRRNQAPATRPAAAALEFRILAARNPAKPEWTASRNPEYERSVQQYLDLLKNEGPTTRPSDVFRWFKIADADPKSFSDARWIVGERGGSRYVLAYDTPDMGLLKTMGWSIRSVRAGHDVLGRPAIDFRLAGSGPKLFGELTGNNIDRPLGIFVDNEVISVATIKSAIFESGQITGRFSAQYVNDLVARLSAGE
jgi:hypothetical protein